MTPERRPRPRHGDDGIRELLHELVERTHADATPEERAQRHHEIDNPAPAPAVGSKEWIDEQALLHTLVEQARARNAAEAARISEWSRNPENPANQPGYRGTVSGVPVFGPVDPRHPGRNGHPLPHGRNHP